LVAEKNYQNRVSPMLLILKILDLRSCVTVSTRITHLSLAEFIHQQSATRSRMRNCFKPRNIVIGETLYSVTPSYITKKHTKEICELFIENAQGLQPGNSIVLTGGILQGKANH